MRARTLVILIICLLLLGMGLWAYQGYRVYRSAEVSECKVTSVRLEDWHVVRVPGIPIPIPFPETIDIKLKLILENPSSASFEVRLITYDVYVEGIYLGRGEREHIMILPGTNEIELDFKASTEKLARLLALLLYRAASSRSDTITLHVEVKGIVKIPVKLFGVIEVPSLTITIPYSASRACEVRLPGA